jgi:hypothetical protein
MTYRTAEETTERQAAILSRFRDGEFSPDVLRASLFILGWRGADLDSVLRQEMERRHELRDNLQNRNGGQNASTQSSECS